MILAQVGPVVHEVIVQSSTPWHVYIAAAVATGVAIAGWYVVHRTSQNRDQQNWRRTTLLQAVANLLDASHRRLTISSDSNWQGEKRVQRTELDRMAHAQNIISICEAEALLSASKEIIKQHIISEHAMKKVLAGIKEGKWPDRSADYFPEDLKKIFEEAKINPVKLKELHDELIAVYLDEVNPRRR